MSDRKKKKQSGNDTLYHVLFWVIVVVLFPISLSVFFLRTKMFGLSRISGKTKRIILAVFWCIVALIIVVFAVVMPASKKKKAENAASRSESIAQSEAEERESESRSREAEENSSVLSIRFLDMNQADAILVSCDGHHMIIDSGDVSSILSARLLETDMSYVDYIVASTPYNESVGGFARAMNYLTIGKAYCSVTAYDSDKFKDFKQALDLQNVAVQVPKNGDTVELGRAQVVFFRTEGTDDAPGSLIVMIEHKNRRILLSGNAYAKDLEALSAEGYDIDCDLIKIGHHGCDGSLSSVVMQKTSPYYAVISCGEGYGCPSQETLLYLKNEGVKTYRTDLQGNIDYESTLSKLTITPAHGEDLDTLDNNGSGYIPTGSDDGDATQEPTPEAAPENQPGQDTASTDTPAEAETDASGCRYARNMSDNYVHRLNCPEIAGLTWPQLEKYTNSRDDLVNGWGLTPCPVCNP